MKSKKKQGFCLYLLVFQVHIALLLRLGWIMGLIRILTHPNSELNALSSQFDNIRQPQYPRKDSPICSHCGYKGHVAEKCYKLHGYPPGFQRKPRNAPAANQVSCPMTMPPDGHDNSQNVPSLAMQCQ
jgi:hypothetical protein